MNFQHIEGASGSSVEMNKVTLRPPVFVFGEVEKILKGILDLIPSTSPSLKIQIIGGKVCLLEVIRLGDVNKPFVF